MMRLLPALLEFQLMHDEGNLIGLLKLTSILPNLLGGMIDGRIISGCSTGLKLLYCCYLINSTSFFSRS